MLVVYQHVVSFHVLRDFQEWLAVIIWEGAPPGHRQQEVPAGRTRHCYRKTSNGRVLTANNAPRAAIAPAVDHSHDTIAMPAHLRFQLRNDNKTPGEPCAPDEQRSTRLFFIIHPSIRPTSSPSCINIEPC